MCFYFAVMVRTILPSTIPPSYRGATIRYLYYVRSILSGQYLMMENGHFREESIRDLDELVSSLLFCSSFIYTYHPCLIWFSYFVSFQEHYPALLWHALVIACLTFLRLSHSHPSFSRALCGHLLYCLTIFHVSDSSTTFWSAACQSWIN